MGRYPGGCVRMKEWTRALVAEESGSEDEGWCVVDDVCNDVLSTLMSAHAHQDHACARKRACVAGQADRHVRDAQAHVARLVEVTRGVRDCRWDGSTGIPSRSLRASARSRPRPTGRRRRTSSRCVPCLVAPVACGRVLDHARTCEHVRG